MQLGIWGRGSLMVLAMGSATAASPSNAPTIAVLAEIEPGEWQLREQGSTAAPTQRCVVDADMLIQLQHPGARCTRFVVEDQPRTGTVQYSCPGAGNGRTTIKLEGRRGFHLDTQGVAAGAPFSMSFEARLMGPCGTSAH